MKAWIIEQAEELPYQMGFDPYHQKEIDPVMVTMEGIARAAEWESDGTLYSHGHYIVGLLKHHAGQRRILEHEELHQNN